jgi:crossover junction endodeoxyribonuclease RuvC
MVIWGVDPGNEGAVAVLGVAGDRPYILEVADMPTVTRREGVRLRTTIEPEGLAALMRRLMGEYMGPDVVVIERVTASPGAGVAGMFRFGRGLGLVEGMVAVLGLPSVMVPPAVWKGAMRLGRDKAVARRAAMELWPGQAHLFERSMDDGRAEAALIARWRWLCVARKAG